MSAPIDELMISIGIEEGSNLAELYDMLRQIQSGGGNIQVDLSGVATRQQVTGLGTRITNLTNTLSAQLQRSPEITPGLLEAINNVITQMAEVRSVVTALQHGVMQDLFRIGQSADILSNSLGWIETAQKGSSQFYEKSVELIKVVNNIFEFLKTNLGTEGFAERFEGKLDEIKRQCVHKEVQDIIFQLRKIENLLPKIKGHTTTKLEGAVSELTDRLVHIKNDTELLRQKFDLMKSAEFDITPFIDEVNSLSRNLDQLLDGMMMQWVDRIIAKEIDIAGMVDKLAGHYNTILHHYLKQEIKVDRFTNLLGEKITAEAQEFKDTNAAIKDLDTVLGEKITAQQEKFDETKTAITDMSASLTENIVGQDKKFDATNKSIKDLGTKVFKLGIPLQTMKAQMAKLREEMLTILTARDVLTKVIQEVPTMSGLGPSGWDAMMGVLNVMARTGTSEEIMEKVQSQIRPGIRNIEDITQKEQLIKTLGLEEVTGAAQVDDILDAINEQIFEKHLKPAYDQTKQLWDDMTKWEEENTKKLDSIKDTVERTDDKLERKSPADESDERDEKGRFKKQARVGE